jgi:hypothetical protein
MVGSSLAADGNHDGVVDMGDYIIWRKAFQSIAGSGSGLTSPTIPEPNTCAMAVVGLITLFANSARRWR